MARPISFAVNEYYHLYNRGNSKQNIFLDVSDYYRFIKLLFLANSHLPIDKHQANSDQFSPFTSTNLDEPIVDIGAYCLMTNHFHLLVREREEGGISEFIHKLSTSYVMYLNRKHKRVGALFEGSFKAKHIEDDQVLRYMFAYIHLNPVKIIEPRWKEKGIVDKRRAIDFLNHYDNSSYFDYINKRPTNLILNKKAFPDYFSQPHDFENFVQDWLTFANFQGEA